MKPRLLLVEDNSANLRLLRDWLESEDFAVSTAETLAAACESVERQAPDAILLDIRVGAENGLDLVRWIRGEAKLCRIPVIAVTAHALRAEQEHILAQGCNAIVSKPVDFRQLRRQLDLWLSLAAAQKASSGGAA